MADRQKDWELVPRRGEETFAFRMPDGTMAPLLPEGGIVYVESRPVGPGDVGVFLLRGQAVCRQYYRDPLGMVYLFVLDRRFSWLDRLVPPKAQGDLVCLGRVAVPTQPLPGRE